MSALSAVTCSEAPGGVLVLDGVPCEFCYGTGKYDVWGSHPDGCTGCNGSGFVRPQVSVGQRIAVVVDGLLVGTVTATTEALPIDREFGPHMRERHIEVQGGRLQLWEEVGASPFGPEPTYLDIDRSSLPDDLVGRWAVLVDDLTPTTERCPFGHDDPPMFRAEDINSGAPLDGTRLAADIARTVPEANREVRRSEWRSEVKRRARDRMACPACSCPPLPVSPGPERVLWTLDLPEVAR